MLVCVCGGGVLDVRVPGELLQHSVMFAESITSARLCR